jgi:DNA polymerase-1
VKKAMIGIGLKLEESGLKAKMLLQVHDELIFEAPLEEVEDVTSMVEYQMTHAASLSVPLRCSIETGSDWGKMH